MVVLYACVLGLHHTLIAQLSRRGREQVNGKTERSGARSRSRKRADLCSYARLQSYLTEEKVLRRNRVMQPPPAEETRRLTSHLRTFGGVSSDVSREPILVDERVILRKQKIKRASDTPEKKWSDLKVEISGRCSGTELTKVSCWCALNRVNSL